jgi:hypothetical protein
MLTTSDIPLDYLKVPTNQKLVNSKLPHRTSSFIVQSNQPNERIASNLSLPSAGNSILKSPDSSSQRQSTSSRLSVHYTPVVNEDELEFIPSLIIPTIESSSSSSSFIENTPTNNRHAFKIPKHYGFHELLDKSSCSDLFLHGR